jgi:citrate synthase
MHGASGSDAHSALLSVMAGRSPQTVAADFLRRDERPPGLTGPAADPRAAALLSMLDAVEGADRVLDPLARLVRAFRADDAQQPSIELALAALAAAAGMAVGAGDVVLAVGRSAGWMAHAMEEYREQPLRWRVRELYTGEPSRELPSSTPASGPPPSPPHSTVPALGAVTP